MRGKVALAAAVIALAMSPGLTTAAEPSVEAYYSKTYNACMDEAGGSTMPMRDCLDAEYGDWDKALNHVYLARMASRPASDQIRLRADERVWLKRTKTKCEHAGDVDSGGTLQPIDKQLCYLDETIRRTTYLRGLH